MEGKDSKSCCPSGGSCGPVTVPATSKAVCKCGPGWTCVIKKVEAPDDAKSKPFYNCSTEGCVCITDDKSKAEGSGGYQIVETDGAFCDCGDGYTCTFTKTEGPDAGKVFLECGNGCKCEIPGSNGVVVLKDA